MSVHYGAPAFFFEEVTKQALDRWLYRTFFDHPTENRFSAQEFASELDRSALTLGAPIDSIFFRDFFAGVAKRNGTKSRKSDVDHIQGN